jgi:hypothetical protein
MPQETADEAGHFVLADSQANEAVLGMTEMAPEKTQVTSEESHFAKTVKERNDLSIFHALPTDFMTDLPNRKSPSP